MPHVQRVPSAVSPIAVPETPQSSTQSERFPTRRHLSAAVTVQGPKEYDFSQSVPSARNWYSFGTLQNAPIRGPGTKLVATTWLVAATVPSGSGEAPVNSHTSPDCVHAHP